MNVIFGVKPLPKTLGKNGNIEQIEGLKRRLKIFLIFDGLEKKCAKNRLKTLLNTF